MKTLLTVEQSWELRNLGFIPENPPYFTLTELLELFPESIVGKASKSPTIYKDVTAYFTIDKFNDWWGAGYCILDSYVFRFSDKELIDTLFSLAKFCIQEGYIETK